MKDIPPACVLTRHLSQVGPLEYGAVRQFTQYVCSPSVPCNLAHIVLEPVGKYGIRPVTFLSNFGLAIQDSIN